jgi:hypothetical protein
VELQLQWPVPTAKLAEPCQKLRGQVIRQRIQKKHWWMLQGLVLWSQTLVALATDLKEDHAPTVLKTHCGYQLGGFVVIKLEAQWLPKLKWAAASQE